MTHSIDFRRKVLSVREKEGLTIAEVADRFGVGIASVTRWIRSVEKKPQGPRRRKIDLEALRRDIVECPYDYQYERAKRFGVAQNAIFFALKKLRVSYKKTLTHPKADEDARRAFVNKIVAYAEEDRTIVDIDESGFAHDMPRRHGTRTNIDANVDDCDLVFGVEGRHE